MNPTAVALFAGHCERVAEEFTAAVRRVGLLAGRRATENGRDPIDACDKARAILQERGSAAAVGTIVDEVAGPLDRGAFADWMRRREATRQARRFVPC